MAKLSPSQVQRERPDCITPGDIARLRAASRFTEAEFEAWYVENAKHFVDAKGRIGSRDELRDIFAAHR